MTVFETAALAAVLALAAPLALAMLGALLTERAGLRQFGIEGILLAGWLGAGLAISSGGGMPAALLTGVTLGAVLGLGQAMAVVWAGTGPIATGFAMSLLAQALVRLWSGSIPGGPADAGSGAMATLALLATALLWWGLARTPLGSALRAAGDAPGAVVRSGLSLRWLRSGAMIAGSGLIGLAGAGLAMGGSRAAAMPEGLGWLALALVAVAARHPALCPPVAVIAALMVAFLPSGPAMALPWIGAVAALALVGWRGAAPQALRHRLRDEG